MTANQRLLPAALIVLVLAACGGGTDTASPAAEASAAESTRPSDPMEPSAEASADAPSAGASAAASAGAEAELPDGWTSISVADAGFSIGLPESWQEMSAETLADSGVFEELSESNPDAAVALEQARVAIESGQIGLFAFDSQDAGTGFATNLNVINVGLVTETPEEAAEQIAAAIEGSVPITGEVTTATTSLPAGDAAVVTYQWNLTDAAGASTAVTVRQYAIITDGGTGYVLSFSSASDSFAAEEATFEQIAETFRATGD